MSAPRHIWTSPRGILDLGFQGYSCNWGTSIAILYEDLDSVLPSIMRILHAGLLAENRQNCFLSEPVLESLIHLYEKKHPAEAVHLQEPEHFSFTDPGKAETIFNPDDPLQISDHIDNFYYSSQIDKETPIRSILDIRQALPFYKKPTQLAEMIFHINLTICSKDWLQVVLYDLNEISATFLMAALEYHAFVLRNNKLIQNTLYKEDKKK